MDKVAKVELPNDAEELAGWAYQHECLRNIDTEYRKTRALEQANGALSIESMAYLEDQWKWMNNAIPEPPRKPTMTLSEYDLARKAFRT